MTQGDDILREFPLPPGFRLPAGTPDDVPVRRAATVMLVRPEPSSQVDGGIEVFTFRRRGTLAFAAGMLVFPGGAVEPGDAADLPWAGPSPAVLAERLGCDADTARAVVAAAVRETFEECGVLLAGPAPGAEAGPPRAALLDDPAWESRRRALLDGHLTLGAVLRDAGLVLRADLLHPWARWVTPPGERRRFDTWFLAARLPAGQVARDLGGEGERAAWRAPSEVLTEHRAGRALMLPPTIVAMEELAAAGSVARLLATPRRLRPVSPRAVEVGPGPDGAPRHVLRVHLDGRGGGEPERIR